MRRFAAAVVVLALAGCGGDSGGEPRLTVAAASSLRDALTAYARNFDGADVKLSFAGSDAIAAQIRAGVNPDVFVSADAVLANRLHDDGLTRQPVPVASNRLAVAVPAKSPRVRSFADLDRPGIKIALGTPSVPVGAYAEMALARLPAGQRQRILANVRTREPDVAGVLGKVAAGAVDAGVVYVTDVKASDGVRAVAVPSGLQPDIQYAAAVTNDSAVAMRFVAGLAKSRELRDAGFGPP